MHHDYLTAECISHGAKTCAITRFTRLGRDDARAKFGCTTLAVLERIQMWLIYLPNVVWCISLTAGATSPLDTKGVINR